ncbi:helix-turn-helix domain-containing protein [Ruoffia tabacinasalis]
MERQKKSFKFKVSYNNVYAWVNIYKKHGPGGLIDSRGRSKPLQY